MRTFFSLAKQHLRHYRLTTSIWLCIMAMMAYMVASVAKSVVAGDSLKRILDSLGGLKNLFGEPGTYEYPVDLYIQGKWLAFMPLLVGIFAVLSAMGLLAREIDRRTADFILTLPVRRATVLLSRFAALAVNIILLYAGSILMIWAGLRQAHVQGALGNYALFSLGQLALTLFIAALTVYISLRLDDYAAANRYALIGVVVVFSLNLVLRSVKAPQWLLWITLFNLADPEGVVGRGQFPWPALIAGALLTAVCLFGSVRVLEKKQVPA